VSKVYSTVVTVNGGRDGRARSADGNLELDLTVPKELGGPGGSGTNPEQLFAAGYAACFESGLRYAATRRGMELGEDESSVTGEVSLVPDEKGTFKLAVQLEVSFPSAPRAELEELADVVHRTMCPYSKALSGNVDVDIRIV
jgi:Ohr subfamily peroxiredoxin